MLAYCSCLHNEYDRVGRSVLERSKSEESPFEHGEACCYPTIGESGLLRAVCCEGSLKRNCEEADLHVASFVYLKADFGVLTVVAATATGSRSRSLVIHRL